MTVYYSQPKLKSLSQGDRLAFVRQLRRMSQQELGERIGLPAYSARNLICRYETKNRNIRANRLEAMAKVLNVDVAMLNNWDFTDSNDLYHLLLWMEEICPGYTLRYANKNKPCNMTHETLSVKYSEWLNMRRKFAAGKIGREDYWEWKLRSDCT